MANLTVTEDALCDDCPPVGYPTDKTRCLSCPRRDRCTQVGDVIHCQCGKPSSHYGTMGERGAREVREAPPPKSVTSNERVLRCQVWSVSSHGVTLARQRAGMGPQDLAEHRPRVGDEFVAAEDFERLEAERLRWQESATSAQDLLDAACNERDRLTRELAAEKEHTRKYAAQFENERLTRELAMSDAGGKLALAERDRLRAVLERVHTQADQWLDNPLATGTRVIERIEKLAREALESSPPETAERRCTCAWDAAGCVEHN